MTGAAKGLLVDRRAGFVRPVVPRWAVPRYVIAFAVAVVVVQASLFVFAGTGTPLSDRLAVMVPFALFSGLLLYLAWLTRLPRYAVVALVPPITGLATSPVDLRDRHDVTWLALALGVALLVSGSVALKAFLARHLPRAAD